MHTNWDTLTEEVERDGEVPEGVPKLNAPLHTVTHYQIIV